MILTNTEAFTDYNKAMVELKERNKDLTGKHLLQHDTLRVGNMAEVDVWLVGTWVAVEHLPGRA